MVTGTCAHEAVIDCREDDGALRNFLRANNRKLHWEDICAELIDNALEHSGDVCHVDLMWSRRNDNTFRVVDDGHGSSDIQAFFKPGKSVQTGKSQGNSTFGVGLFVCECCISNAKTNSVLRVATHDGGPVMRVGIRTINNGSDVASVVVEANDEARMSYGLSSTGTSVTFSRFAKALPNTDAVNRIANKLGMWYGSAINSGSLVLSLTRNNVTEIVPAEALPACDELKTASIEIDGHRFEIEWGVTADLCRDNGCRMIYGGKFFETSQEPCGEYRLGRFYASVRVPRTIGKDSMDILKRTIDHESIDELFDQCAELFRPELERSDVICKEGDDETLNSSISTLLSMAIRRDQGKDAPTSDDGDDDVRAFNGRDLTSDGVAPKNSGRKRKGRRTRSRNLPGNIVVRWAPLGDDKGLAVYHHDAHRVTFNEDLPMMLSLRAKKEEQLLAAIAAGHIAKDIEGSEKQRELGFGDYDFAWIYREMMSRVLQSHAGK